MRCEGKWLGHQNLLVLGALSFRSWLPILEALVNCKKRNVNCNLFTHEALKTRLNVLVRGIIGYKKTGVPGEKPLGARERVNNKINPDIASTL